MFGVFFISIIMLLLYAVTRSIWTPIGCHFCWDSLFMSLDERENDFGIIDMKTYVRDAELIDNISILVTGAILVLLLIIMRTRIESFMKSHNSMAIDSR
jgi:membrane protease YdiL (CAAX protease family)